MSKEFVSYLTTFLTVYFLVGVGFGVLGVQLGYPVWMLTLMSFAFYSGAGQLLTLALLGEGASLLAVVGAVSLLNIRHLFYGVSVKDALPQRGFLRVYSIFSLTDEAWALASYFPAYMRGRTLVLVFFVFHMFWSASTLLGALLGGLIPEISHIPLLLVYAFAIMSVDIYAKQRNGLPYVYACAGYAGSIVILGAPSLYGTILGGFVLIVGTLLWRHTRRAV